MKRWMLIVGVLALVAVVVLVGSNRDDGASEYTENTEGTEHAERLRADSSGMETTKSAKIITAEGTDTSEQSVKAVDLSDAAKLALGKFAGR